MRILLLVLLLMATPFSFYKVQADDLLGVYQPAVQTGIPNARCDYIVNTLRLGQATNILNR